MNELDYAVAAVLLGSMAIGAWRGAIRELMNLVGWVLAFFAAQLFADDLATKFAEWLEEPALRLALAWLLVFVATLMAASLLGSLAAELVKQLGLGMLDRGMGVVVGFARGGIVLIMLTLAAGLTTFPRSLQWKQAAATPWLEIAALYARAWLPQALAKRIQFDRRGALPA